MKRYKIWLCAAVLALTATACHKTCTCTRMDGGVTEYTSAELDSLGYNCTTIENINYGLTYAQCEW